MKISVQEKAVVYRNLATLVNSGVHILEALESLEVQVRNPQLQEALKRVTGRVSQGHPLHNAMAKERELFSTLVIALVKVGEKTGKLHNILERIAELTQNRDKLLRQLQSALAYPALVLTLCLLLLLFAPVLVFSDLLDLLRQLDTELPLVTQIYLAFSSAILSPLTYLVTVPLLGAGLYTVRTLLRNEERRQSFEEALFALPGLGDFLRLSVASGVADSMATCYEAGLPILDSFRLAAQSTVSLFYKNRLLEAREALKRGEGLAECLTDIHLFQPAHLVILHSGEETGQTASALKMVAEQASSDVEYAVESFQKLLEPCLLLFVGLVVGFIAVAVLSPTLKMVEGL